MVLAWHHNTPISIGANLNKLHMPNVLKKGSRHQKSLQNYPVGQRLKFYSSMYPVYNINRELKYKMGTETANCMLSKILGIYLIKNLREQCCVFSSWNTSHRDGSFEHPQHVLVETLEIIV